MTAGSRRITAQLATALLALGLALFLGALNVKAAAANPLLIAVKVGYFDAVKDQQWMPISIAVTNNGPQVDGTLEIANAGVGNASRFGPVASATYERPMVLATGATKYFRIYLILAPGTKVTVRIVKDGRVLASQDAQATRSPTTLIGVLSDDSTALSDFSAVHPASVTADVVHLGLGDLVDSPIALRAFDLLAIDDFATDALTEGQRAAITDYVRNGGALLIGTGPSWRRTLAGLPADILPLKVAGLTALASIQSLGGVGEVQVATGTLSGGSAWLVEGDQPLLIEKRVGSGTVTLATFDWKQEPIASWTGTKSVLRQVLVRTVLGSQSQQNSQLLMGGPFGGPVGTGGGSIVQRSAALSQVLGSLPALDLPSLALTGSLVLVYVLLVGPVNYLVLRALHRRALAWITLPLIAVVVAAGAYGGGISSKGVSVQTNQLSIIHVQPGSDRAYQETYDGVLTPTRGDYEVSTGDNSALVSSIADYNGYGGVGRADIRVDIADGKVLLPGMTAFTLRGFGTESMITAPQLTGHLQALGGSLTGTIENQSSMTFTDAVVVAGDSFQKLGAIAPGARVPVSFVPRTMSFGGPPAIYSIYPNYSFGPQNGSPSEVQREGEAKTRILSLLGSGSFKSIPSTEVVPMVIGWTNQSFLPFTVNRLHPHSHAVTAVVAQLPVDLIGAGPLPAGAVSSRMIDFEGDTQSGPPGVLNVQNGTVTFSFTPKLARGLQLRGTTFTIANPYFGKVPGGPAGPVSTIQGQAWDWTTSTWFDIKYVENGTTAIPSAAINPASSEIRVRFVVNNGSFLATGMSLAGDAA